MARPPAIQTAALDRADSNRWLAGRVNECIGSGRCVLGLQRRLTPPTAHPHHPRRIASSCRWKTRTHSWRSHRTCLHQRPNSTRSRHRSLVQVHDDEATFDTDRLGASVDPISGLRSESQSSVLGSERPQSDAGSQARSNSPINCCMVSGGFCTVWPSVLESSKISLSLPPL